MKIEKIQKFSLDSFILICSLPDMGKVGGLVTQHLLKFLNAKATIKFTLNDKPWVNQKNGIISVPQDDYILAVDEKNKIVLFTGDNQPQEPSTVMDLTNVVFEEAEKIGKIKMIISTGGYMPAKKSETNFVYGVATNHKALEFLKKHDVIPLSDEVGSITWFNGLILGKALKNNIDGVGLFGEITDTNTEQYNAASMVLKKIQMLINTEIDTQELDEKIPKPIKNERSERPGIG